MSTERRTPLDRKRVADTALKLLNETGLDGLTLRAIATALDVKAPALYWHFKDKQALLDEMATEMYRRMVAGAVLDPADTWVRRLTVMNRSLRAALLGYRDGARVFSGSRFTGVDHAVEMEQNLALLTGAGFTLVQAVRATTTAYSYTIGFVVEEQAVKPLPDERTAGYDLDERARLLARFPLSAEAGTELFDRHDEGFEEGLALIVAGVGVRYGVS
ncbi:TetR/AcrR family transcriptional regulator C-terminal domain-containing protein [Streptomyces mangrovisoli]|uniref:TetR family transcriptional regulator n=1 Tax=Streptomyces mangrovisoli TaxID=1428628 RepID=A0A1J4NPB2_9ACTN|nr:TetR/AcrR family transcriptional regulator C-terminal domain-containing protein [Streptomyces mangrovisoli]OIJ64199.1 TetR family transcriptional regulator [Streptomyces mangrovisoli]